MGEEVERERGTCLPALPKTFHLGATPGLRAAYPSPSRAADPTCTVGMTSNYRITPLPDLSRPSPLQVNLSHHVSQLVGQLYVDQ
ncbi:hypothetical protein CRG98_007211 [Punica granatum]|uniref:Uncharacterized protein n=1 Tax=Punica granatum TaxID=22663 RepID=A0A2I0KV44_PUNGR|nr:hypothetical protein CRG98_007211 [Punica granatum]